MKVDVDSKNTAVLLMGNASVAATDDIQIDVHGNKNAGLIAANSELGAGDAISIHAESTSEEGKAGIVILGSEVTAGSDVGMLAASLGDEGRASTFIYDTEIDAGDDALVWSRGSQSAWTWIVNSSVTARSEEVEPEDVETNVALLGASSKLGSARAVIINSEVSAEDNVYALAFGLGDNASVTVVDSQLEATQDDVHLLALAKIDVGVFVVTTEEAEQASSITAGNDIGVHVFAGEDAGVVIATNVAEGQEDPTMTTLTAGNDVRVNILAMDDVLMSVRSSQFNAGNTGLHTFIRNDDGIVIVRWNDNNVTAGGSGVIADIRGDNSLISLTAAGNTIRGAEYGMDVDIASTGILGGIVHVDLTGNDVDGLDDETQLSNGVHLNIDVANRGEIDVNVGENTINVGKNETSGELNVGLLVDANIGKHGVVNISVHDNERIAAWNNGMYLRGSVGGVGNIGVNVENNTVIAERSPIDIYVEGAHAYSTLGGEINVSVVGNEIVGNKERKNDGTYGVDVDIIGGEEVYFEASGNVLDVEGGSGFNVNVTTEDISVITFKNNVFQTGAKIGLNVYVDSDESLINIGSFEDSQSGNSIWAFEYGLRIRAGGSTAADVGIFHNRFREAQTAGIYLKADPTASIVYDRTDADGNDTNVYEGFDMVDGEILVTDGMVNPAP